MRQNKIAVFVHVVWGTWDRLPLLTPRIAPRVYAAIAAKCGELGAQVVALGGVEDHVHLLVHMPATLALADLVKHVKGASSHLATHEADAVAFRWQGAYGAFSVGVRDLEQVSAYIRGQREHHTTGSLVAEWELEG